jgi:DNA-binding response OmpR family regulator
MARTQVWDLLLIDLMLPGFGGERIIRQLRQLGSAVPILIISAKDSVSDRVEGLRVGADDYITKPFEYDEFLARIEAHLRRGPASVESSSPLEKNWLDTTKADTAFGEFVIHYKSGQLLRSGQVVPVSHQEFRLLCLFVQHPHEVLGTDKILSLAWGYEALVTSRTVYVHVAWLRKKLRTEANGEGHIATVRGLGYVFQP